MSKYKHNLLTDHKLLAAEKHLIKKDKIMARLILQYGRCELMEKEFSPFHALAKSIISQQLSAQAAATIEHRITEVISTPFKPQDFLNVAPEELRKKGLSGAKIRYILALSKSVMDGELCFEELIERNDQSVIETLTKIPGIGRWTAEMFLIFGLKRLNVLALGDAGLQRAAILLYKNYKGKDKIKLLMKISQAWQPYRSIASWYLWKSLDSKKKSK